MLIRSGKGASFYGTVAATAAALACGTTKGPVAPSAGVDPSAPPARRIVVLGDSLAVSPSKATAFPARLQERLATTHPGWVVSNEGVGGDTTTGGLQRLERAVPDDTAILILELGANDGLRGMPIQTIEANLSNMIERVRAQGVTVLLCGMETPPFKSWEYTVDFHRVFPRVAERYDLPLVPFLLDGVALNPVLNGDDLIHPNAEGARRIAETVWPYLEPLVHERKTAPRS